MSQTKVIRVSTKRRPNTQKQRLGFFAGLSNQGQANWDKAFPQSSFCRLGQLKLQNEDPRSNALFDVNGHEINGSSFYRSGRLKLQNEDPRSNALFDVNADTKSVGSSCCRLGWFKCIKKLLKVVS